MQKKMKISVNSLISNGQEVRGYPPFGTAGRAIITINPVVLNFIGTSSNFGTMTFFVRYCEFGISKSIKSLKFILVALRITA